MEIYKHNLRVLNGRYGSYELRILNFFAQTPTPRDIRLLAEMRLFVQHLLEDGLIQDTGNDQPIAGGEIIRLTFVLTPAGQEYVNRWIVSGT